MLNTRNHTLLRSGLRNEGRVFARYLVRVGAGVAAVTLSILAVGSLQSGSLRDSLGAIESPVTQVGHGQFGDMPMTSIEASMGTADPSAEPLRVALPTTRVFEVYDDSSGELIARMLEKAQEVVAPQSPPTQVATTE